MNNILPDLLPLAVPLERVAPLPDNPRKGDVDAVAGSFAAFGQRKPIVARKMGADGDGNNTGIVLAGNHSLAAARKLGWDSIAVVWTDDDEMIGKAYALADNHTAELGGYDEDLLIEMIRTVSSDPALLAATAYSDDDLSKLLGNKPMAGDTDPDDAPEPPKDPITRMGDLWILGNHKVLCGDSTKAESFARLMGDERADLVWTDPPYGVAYVGKTKDALTIENDDLDAKGLEEFLALAMGGAVAVCKRGAAWYVAAPAGPLFNAFGNVLLSHGIWRQTITWVKDQFVMGRSDYHYRHEAIFYGWVPDAAHHAIPDRTQDTVWEIARPKRSAEHPTMKPVELVARAIRNSSDAGAVVLDPFGGSGTTLVAAYQERRVARLIEFDERYVDVICRRYQDFTGDKPVLDSTGEPHDFTVE